MIKRLQWLSVLVFMLLLAACTASQGEPAAVTTATDLADSSNALTAVDPTPTKAAAAPTATPEGPLVTTAEPQSVEVGSADSAEASKPEAEPVATPEEPDVVTQQDQPFMLAYQQTALVADDDLFVTFVAVPEDSRCPKGVDCVWSGAVTVELQMILPDSPVITGTLRLVGGVQEGTGELLPGYVFTLLRVDPYPVNGQLPTPLESYAIELQIGTRPIRPTE